MDDGDILILRGLRSAQNPNVADPASLQIVDDDRPPGSNHNGGQLAFGPDGALYASIGDNGSGANAQSGGTFFGKILRFADPRTDAAPAIWARGLRNPWRFSFDRVTGDVWIGDVGELTQEEIDHVPFSVRRRPQLRLAGLRGHARRLQRLHGAGDDASSTARATPPIIGGFVVRDPGLPSLAGRYLFGDLAKPTAFSAAVAAPSAAIRAGRADGRRPRSFGEDGCGRIYVATASQVRRVTETASTTCVPPVALPGPPGGGEQPPPGGRHAGADTTRPAVTREARQAPRPRLRPQAPLGRGRARDRHRARLQVAHASSSPPASPRRSTVKARRKTIRKLRGKRRVVRKVRIRVVDTAGNSTRPHAEDPAALSRRVP